MANEDEVEDVADDEVEDQVEASAEDESTADEDATDWKAKFKETEGRLKRAETKLAKNKEPKESTDKSPSKSDGLDYGQKAFATAHELNIKGLKEFEFVQSELKKSGEDLESLLENDYFKTRLENFRALGKTDEATPKGNRSSGVATETVEYWMAKPFEEVPKDMRSKVVQAKLDKEKNKGNFYNS